MCQALHTGCLASFSQQFCEEGCESQSPRGESCRTAEWLAAQRYLANVEAGSRRWVARHLRQQYECSVHIPQNPLVLQYQVANHRVGERKTHDEKSST